MGLGDQDRGEYVAQRATAKGFRTSTLYTRYFLLISYVCDYDFSVYVQATWQHERRWIKAHGREHVNLADLGPLDPNQPHMTNSQPSISLVKSDGCDLISHSANRGVTRGCLWILR